MTDQIVDLHPVPAAFTGTLTKRERPVTRLEYDGGVKLLARYVEHLEALDLSDPTPASDHHARAERLRKASRDVVAAGLANRAQIVSDLAAGEADEADAHRALGKGLLPSSATEAARIERDTLRDAAWQAHLQGLRAIRTHPEDDWVELVKQAGAAALEAPFSEAEARWDGALDLYALLRRIGAVSTVEGISRDASWWWSSRPNAVMAWYCAGASRVDSFNFSRQRVDGAWHRIPSLKGAPRLTFTDIAKNRTAFDVGLLAPAEVLANVLAQQAFIARAFATEPQPQPVTA